MGSYAERGNDGKQSEAISKIFNPAIPRDQSSIFNPNDVSHKEVTHEISGQY